MAWLRRLTLSPVEAAFGEDEPRDETQIMWSELEVLAAGICCERNLVCAGPGPEATS